MNPIRHYRLHRKIEKLFKLAEPTFGDSATCWICGLHWYVPVTGGRPEIHKRKVARSGSPIR